MTDPIIGIRFFDSKRNRELLYCTEGFFKTWLWIRMGNTWRRWREGTAEDRKEILLALENSYLIASQRYPDLTEDLEEQISVLKKEIQNDYKLDSDGSIPDEVYSPFVFCGHAEALWGDSA